MGLYTVISSTPLLPKFRLSEAFILSLSARSLGRQRIVIGESHSIDAIIDAAQVSDTSLPDCAKQTGMIT